MTRNLVMGSEGFVGRPLSQYLRSIGEEVVECDLKLGGEYDLKEIRVDFDGIDRVYFLAWDVGGAKYLYRKEYQLRQLDWNLKLLTNVMRQLQMSKIPFLFVSSQLAEESDTVYGVTKRLGEVWTTLLSGLQVRLWNVYGPFEKPSERTHVVSDFVYQALTTGEIRMLTTGEEQRQFIHIQDVCKALHHVISSGVQGIYDVTSLKWMTIRRLADMIADYAEAKVIPGDRVGNTTLTRIRGQVPDWSPLVKIEDGLAVMVDEMRRWL